LLSTRYAGRNPYTVYLVDLFVTPPARSIIVSTLLVVVGENWINKNLSCDHHNSIGLKSGEYGDKHKIEAPTDSIIDVIESTL
ncbi:hypothetical protein QUA30_22430, partial [Microcoleus sp. Pol14C2]